MMVVYGASDDLVILKSDNKIKGLTEEFYPTAADDKYDFMALSDGTVLSVRYGGDDEACWRFQIRQRGSLIDHKEEATDENDDYSDKVYFKDGITWAVMGSNYTFVKPSAKI